MSEKLLTPIEIGLTAAIVSIEDNEPLILTASGSDGDELAGLPFGPFDAVAHRTLEIGLRSWVEEQTGLRLGYVEQLYTFGDRGRELPQADLGDAPQGARLISVGYLGLTPERTDISGFDAVWRDWYRFFPWEDHRNGRPPAIDQAIAPALATWAAADARQETARLDRASTAFGLDGRPWIEERTLERYELLYEAGLAQEAARDRGPKRAKADLDPAVLGQPMISDHRRILATAIGRLRGKIKYRPVIFELTPERFTLLTLQRVVESLLGQRLHKQNFRRALDRSGLVEGLGALATATGGRPAELFRHKRGHIGDGTPTGVQTPVVKAT